MTSITISEEEFARVVALKAERDALDIEARTARAELDRARIDSIEFKNRQKELAESNKILGHELELAQQATNEAEKRILQANAEKQMLERKSEALEEQIVSLKDQIMMRDSQITTRDAQIQSLKFELETTRLDILQYQVERSKAQLSAQASNELQETITRLENELSIKRHHESLNEQRLIDMQSALSELEALVAKSSLSNADTNGSTAPAVNIVSYDSAQFLDTCSKYELLAKIDILQKDKQQELKSFYMRGIIFFTMALVFLIAFPADDEMVNWITVTDHLTAFRKFASFE